MPCLVLMGGATDSRTASRSADAQATPVVESDQPSEPALRAVEPDRKTDSNEEYPVDLTAVLRLAGAGSSDPLRGASRRKRLRNFAVARRASKRETGSSCVHVMCNGIPFAPKKQPIFAAAQPVLGTATVLKKTELPVAVIQFVATTSALSIHSAAITRGIPYVSKQLL